MKPITGIMLTLLPCVMLSSCYRMNTVTFKPSSKVRAASGPTPNIHINTNTTISSPVGGSIKSGKPYSIGIDYTDATYTFAAIEITIVSINYKDGTSDPGVASLKLPLRLAARPHEAVNSTSGGAIVTTKLIVISGAVPGVISRDEPITLRLEGRFIKNSGTKIPFVIHRTYDVQKDQSIQSWSDVISEV